MASSPTLDGFDLMLLAALQEDARLTNQDLASLVRLSPSQCSRRRTRLEVSGLIRGYRAELARERLGFGVLAFVSVVLAAHSPPDVERFRALLGRLPEVQEAFAMTGDADYLVKIVAPDLRALSDIINGAFLAHDSVAHARSSIVLETLKQDNRLPIDGMQKPD